MNYGSSDIYMFIIFGMCQCTEYANTEVINCIYDLTEIMETIIWILFFKISVTLSVSLLEVMVMRELFVGTNCRISQYMNILENVSLFILLAILLCIWIIFMNSVEPVKNEQLV